MTRACTVQYRDYWSMGNQNDTWMGTKQDMCCAMEEHNFMIKLRTDLVWEGTTDLYTAWTISLAGRVDTFKSSLLYELTVKPEHSLCCHWRTCLWRGISICLVHVLPCAGTDWTNEWNSAQNGNNRATTPRQSHPRGSWAWIPQAHLWISIFT